VTCRSGSEPCGRRSNGATPYSSRRGDDEQAAEVLRWLAHASSAAGDSEPARELHAESVALAAGIGNPIQQARALRNAGEHELQMGELARAGKLLTESLELARGAAAANDAAMTLHSLGDLALIRRDAAQARVVCYLEALGSSVNADVMVNCLAGLAGVAALDGLVGTAGRLWGAVESQQMYLGGDMIYPYAGVRYRAALAGVAGETFDDGVAVGRKLSLDQAAAEALDVLGPLADAGAC
jgi:tetratricopeptide (TPR) repeat protein